jgi:hypothetical protein
MTKRKGHLWCAIALYLTKEDVFITTKWEGCLQHAVVLSLSLCQTSKWGRALQMRRGWPKKSINSRLSSHQEDRQRDKIAKKQVINQKDVYLCFQCRRSPHFCSKPPCRGHAPTYPLNHTLVLSRFCPLSFQREPTTSQACLKKPICNRSKDNVPGWKEGL